MPVSRWGLNPTVAFVLFQTRCNVNMDVRKIFCVVMLGALVFLSCAPAAQAAGKRADKLPLKVFQLPDPRQTSAAALADLAVLEAFKKRYPHIRLSSFSGISIEGMGAMDSGPLMAIAGGMSPDIIYVNFRQSDTYISQGFLYPMDEFLKQVSEEELKDRVPPAAWQVIKRKGMKGETHVWAMPYNILVRTLMYRKDLFREANIDHPPRNWDELEEYARKLTRPDKGQYGLIFSKGEHAAWDWITFLWSAGGDAVALDEKGRWRAIFDSDAAVEAMLYFTYLQQRKWTDASGKEQRGYVCKDADAGLKWGEGKIAMRMAYLNERTIAGAGDPDLTGIAPVPVGPTGVRGSELNCTMMGIFSDIQGREGYSAEEIRQAAWDYIWFFGGTEAKRIRTRVFVEQGYGKFVNPMYLKRFGYEEYLELVPKSWLPVWEEALKNGKPEPYGKNCQMVYIYMTRPMGKILQLEEDGKLGRSESSKDTDGKISDEAKKKHIKKILQEHVFRTNEEMIGAISPEERRKRNNVAIVVGICIVSVFLFVVRRVWKIFTPEEALQKGGWQFKKYAWAYVILIPAVGSILLWKYYPMLMGSRMVFQDYRVVGESQFVGLQNLADVLWDPTWWKSLWRTCYYMLLMLCLGFPAPIILAILLAEVSHGKIVYRTLYYLPAVMTGMVVIYLWKLMFDPSDTGVLNLLLGKIGISKLKWLDDERLAMLCCVIPVVWAGMGPGCLLYLAALKTVPIDLYEAADLDGCGFFKKIWHITIPRIKGLIVIQFIGAFIMASQSTGMILVMTFGGPNEATKVAGLHIFQKAYLMLRFGTAVTMAWMLGAVMLCFTTIQLKKLSQMEFVTADSQAAKANK